MFMDPRFRGGDGLGYFLRDHQSCLPRRSRRTRRGHKTIRNPFFVTFVCFVVKFFLVLQFLNSQLVLLRQLQFVQHRLIDLDFKVRSELFQPFLVEDFMLLAEKSLFYFGHDFRKPFNASRRAGHYLEEMIAKGGLDNRADFATLH